MISTAPSCTVAPVVFRNLTIHIIYRGHTHKATKGSGATDGGDVVTASAPSFWYGLPRERRATETPPVTGLSNAEADRRRAAGQGNDVEIRAGRTYGRIVRDNVFNFINNLFYFLGILLLVLGKPLDAFAVVFVIGANTVISLFQEIRAKRVMDKMAILLRPKADVLRDGEWRR